MILSYSKQGMLQVYACLTRINIAQISMLNLDIHDTNSQTLGFLSLVCSLMYITLKAITLERSLFFEHPVYRTVL